MKLKTILSTILLGVTIISGCSSNKSQTSPYLNNSLCTPKIQFNYKIDKNTPINKKTEYILKKLETTPDIIQKEANKRGIEIIITNKNTKDIKELKQYYKKMYLSPPSYTDGVFLSNKYIIINQNSKYLFSGQLTTHEIGHLNAYLLYINNKTEENAILTNLLLDKNYKKISTRKQAEKFAIEYSNYKNNQFTKYTPFIIKKNLN